MNFSDIAINKYSSNHSYTKFQTKSGIWFSGRIACSLFFIGEADESRKNRVDHLEMKLGIIHHIP
jgi:hypothetical protein